MLAWTELHPLALPHDIANSCNRSMCTDPCAPDQCKKRGAMSKEFWKTKESRIHLGQGETCHEKLVEFIRSLKRCKLI
jgi:hypothetical protein